jgi:signal transduction histidine kinase
VAHRADPIARLSVRLRVALAVAVAIAVLLGGAALGLQLRLAHELDAAVDQGLRSRAADVTALVQQADTGLAQARGGALGARGESFAQILTPSGRVVDATPGLRSRPLLSPAELRRAGAATLRLDRPRAPLAPGRARLLTTPVHAQGQRLVVVVGASLTQRDGALADLRRLLLLGAPAILLVASAVGYGAAAGALRPVERMRRRAEGIQAQSPGGRLPVPAARDEIARLGDTLNTMIERLEGALARERTFVSDAGHELRGPLAVLKGEIELALEDAVTAQQFRDALVSASEETDRLARLADDLLVVARSDQGGLPVRPAPLEVGDLFDGIRRRFESAAREHGVLVSTRAPEGLRLVADRLRLEQALGNLVDNALRHSTGLVELVAEGRSGLIALHVLDDGAGFTPGFLGVAFERFTRDDVARGRGGAGLGLAIVAAIAAAHHGTAHARNRPEGGADVWLELPARVPATDQAAGEPPSARIR